MGKLNKTIKWILCSTLILICLYFINGMLFSFWAAGGPPNNYPEIYIHHGVLKFNLAIVSGISAFLVTRNWQSLKTSRIHKTLIIVCCICALYPFVRKQILIDKCLDSGGHWSYEYFQCKK